jgi:hypothetical protein
MLLLTLGTCNIRTGTAAREYALCSSVRRHPKASVFRRLEQRLCETDTVIPTTHVNIGHPRTARPPAKGDVKIAAVEQAVEKLTRYRTRTVTIPTYGPRST